MSRPCEAEHPLSPEQCRICWHYEHNPIYRHRWGGEPLNGHGAVQIVMTAHGIGDGVLMTTVAAGLQVAGRTVYFVCNETVAGFVSLFGGYSRLLTAAISNAHTYVPCTVAAERCTDRPRWMHYAEACGATPLLPEVKPLSSDVRTWAERYRGCAILCPGAAWPSRRWPPEKWKELAFLLVSAGIRAVIIDRTGGQEYGDMLIGLPPMKVAALMTVARCVVSNDSGMAHVAGMLRRPVVVINQDYKGEHIYGLYPGFRNVQGHFANISAADVFDSLPGARPRPLISPDRAIVLAAETRRASSLPGDMAELGVYRGGSAIVMAGAAPEKLLRLFDTFEGHPADDVFSEGHRKGEFATDVAEVRLALFSYRTAFHVGRFPATTIGLDDVRFCLVHLDADLYESTRDALAWFWPRIVPGGTVVLDDVGWERCPGVARALEESGLMPYVERSALHQGVLRKPDPSFRPVNRVD